MEGDEEEGADADVEGIPLRGRIVPCVHEPTWNRGRDPSTGQLTDVRFLCFAVTHGREAVSCDHQCEVAVDAGTAGGQSPFLEFVDGVVG